MPLELRSEQKDLASALSLATRALAAKPTIPILAGILVETTGNEVWLRSTDLELSLRVRLAAEVVNEGRVVVPGHYFAEAVRYLPAGEIWLREEEQRVVLRYPRGETVFSYYDPSQFPVFPTTEGGHSFWLSAQEWQMVLKQVVVACGHDETQPVFSGVLWEAAPGGTLTLVATDTHRLAVWRKQGAGDLTEEVRAVVPRRAMELAARLAQGNEEGLAIEVGKSQVAVNGEGYALVSRLIEAKFPNYQGVLPKELGTQVTVAAEDFLAAIERASVLAKEEEKARANVVKLEMAPGGLTVSARGPLGSLVEPVEAETEGPGGAVYFNARYLLEAVRACAADKVVMRFNRDLSAALVQAAGDDRYLHLVLPVVVHGGG